MTTNENHGIYVAHSELTEPLEYGSQHWPFNPGEERYVSLATYRRSGIEVCTPVWIAELEGRYYLFSEGEAGKVKRLRANSRVRLAACDSRGKIQSGWLNAEGLVVVDHALIERAYKAIQRKYGWQMKMLDFFSKLGGRYEKRAIIELNIIA